MFIFQIEMTIPRDFLSILIFFHSNVKTNSNNNSCFYNLDDRWRAASVRPRLGYRSNRHSSRIFFKISSSWYTVLNYNRWDKFHSSYCNVNDSLSQVSKLKTNLFGTVGWFLYILQESSDHPKSISVWIRSSKKKFQTSLIVPKRIWKRRSKKINLKEKYYLIVMSGI